MNPNYFLRLPIYERVALLENTPDHNTFTTLISMPEFAFFTNNSKLQARVYKQRLDNYFSKWEPYYEANTSWREIYNRLVELENNIALNPNSLDDLLNEMILEGYLMEIKILSLIPVLPDEVGANLAAENGHLAVLQWIKENNLSLPNQNGANWAARNGHLAVLQWMKENSLSLPNQDEANYAAYNGHLAVLQWMKENDLPLPHRDGANWAAYNGRLAVLQWMKENYLSLSTQLGANWAAQNGHLAVLQWMKENNLSLPDQTAEIWASANGHTAVVNWLSSQSLSNQLILSNRSN